MTVLRPAGDLDPVKVREAFTDHVTRSGLSAATARSYDQYAGQFCDWLAGQDERYHGALSDPRLRDYAVRDWRAYLLDAGKAAATVDLALTAVNAMYRFLHMQPVQLRSVRTSAHRTPPKALSADEKKWVLRAAEERGPRDVALVVAGMLVGLRLAEIVHLDVDDLRLSERKGEVQVLGKGTKVRTVPVNAQARQALHQWLADRDAWPGADGPAVFLSREGRRIDNRTVQHAVAKIGQAARLAEPLSPHMLRHTYATDLVHAGVDVVTVATLMGHASVQTTQVYTRPERGFMAEAVDKLTVGY